MLTPNRSIYGMSESMKKILEDVRRATQPKKVAVNSETKDDTLRIKLASALASKRFEPLGRGLYLEASTLNKIGGIWAVKEFENPETHEKEKWLVSYQDDDDNIALRVANEGLKSALGNTLSDKTIARLHFDDDPNAPALTDPWEMTRMLESGDFSAARVEFSDGTTSTAGELSGQMFNVVGGGLVKVASNIRVAADKIPDPKDVPIAQGIKSKNITMDETGGGGTAKVTIEFTDPSKGLDFYQNQVGGGGEKPSEEAPKEEAPKKEENTEQQGPQGPAPAAPTVPPVSMPAGGLGGLAPKSSVYAYTRGGKQNVMITLEKFATDYNSFNTDPIDSGVYDSKSNKKNLPDMSSDPDKRHKKNFNKSGRGYNQDVVLPHELNLDRFQTKTWPKTKEDIISDEDFVEDLPSKSKLPKEPDIILDDEEEETESDIFSFINEEGQKVILSWKNKLQVGDTFMRPDTGDEARVAGYKEINYVSNEQVVSSLMKGAMEPPGTDVDVMEAPVDTKPFHRERVDNAGNIHRYDERGDYHAEGVPAFISPDGHQEYYQHGKYHNDKGPAVIHSDGSVCYYIKGIRVPQEEFNRKYKTAFLLKESKDDISGITNRVLEEGTVVEKEHTDNEDIARQIAIDHLAEDPKYYEKLKEVEKKSSAGPEEPEVETPTKVDPDIEVPERITPQEPNRSPFRTPHINPEYITRPKATRDPYHSLDPHDGVGEDDGW